MRRPRGAKILLAGSGVLLAAMIAPIILPDAPWDGEQRDDVVVEGDTLPVDEDEIFEWVQTEMGADVEPPTIVVTSEPKRTYTRPFGGKSASFHRILLVENETVQSTSKTPTAYYLAEPHTIYLHPSLVSDEANNSSRRALAVLLVEEYVHAIQFRNGTFEWNRPDGDASTDRRSAWQAVKEGGDVYVASQYADEHFPSRQNLSVGVRERYRNVTAVDRYFIAPYYFGDRYLRVRTNAPSAVWDTYSDPPETTEQLLHPRDRADESRTNLEVRTNVNGHITEILADRQGELFVRLVLSQCLSRDRAAQAAAGWGNDRLYPLWSDGARNYAWVLKWDDRAEATEFEDAFRRYLDCRASSDGGEGWRDGDTNFEVRRVTERTVVAFVGKPSFMANVTATERNDTVTIRLMDRVDDDGMTSENENATATSQSENATNESRDATTSDVSHGYASKWGSGPTYSRI
jgi:hypothetical protein